jgi:hypothetical protein
VEVGVPEQFQRLVDGPLDVGLGRSRWPTAVASELIRLGRSAYSSPSATPWRCRWWLQPVLAG